MKAETIFSIANMAAMLSWILLAVAPRWRGTKAVIHAGTVPLLFSAAYLVLIAMFFSSAKGGFGSLEAVMKLFANQWMVLAGWIHYLAFDLLVGAWEVRDSARRKIPHWLVIPCLFFTFMLGPVGFLLYMAIRSVLGREVTDDRNTT